MSSQVGTRTRVPRALRRSQTPAFLLLIGEHDKGLGEPFSQRTISGRRLHAIISELGIRVELANMGTPQREEPSAPQLRYLRLRAAQAAAVVFLGRRVERELKAQISQGTYLPHPASRRRSDLLTLRTGLLKLAAESAGHDGS